MLGQLSIMELKQEAEKVLGEKFNIKDFHFQVILKFGVFRLLFSALRLGIIS